MSLLSRGSLTGGAMLVENQGSFKNKNLSLASNT
jgi:hypothetical protein